MKDRLKHEYGVNKALLQKQYLDALDKHLLARIPPPLQATPCTKITAFIPTVDKRLPAQGNYEFMPEFARPPSATKTKPYWQVVKKIGEGSVGLIYIVVNSKGENYVLKMQVIKPDEPQFMSVEDEVKLQNFFANLNLAPRVIGLTTVQLADPRKTEVKIIVMEPVDFTLDDLLCNPNAFPPSWVKVVAEQIKQLLLVLHKYRLTHGDLHPGNIGFLYDPASKELKLRLIDFGQSSNRASVTAVDAFQLIRAITEIAQVPVKITNVFRTKLTEAGRAIYGPKFVLPTYSYTYQFMQQHNKYSRAPKRKMGYTERELPPADPQFPAWFKAES